MTDARLLTILGIGFSLTTAPVCLAQHVQPVRWAEDQQLDYEIRVATESLIGGVVEELVQEYELQCVIEQSREDGSLLATGRIRHLATQRTTGDETVSISATLEQDGSVVTEPQELDAAWIELAQLVVQNVFIMHVDAGGSVVLLARMEPVIKASDQVDGARVLLGSLDPRTLAGLIEPIFLLDEAAQQDAATWITRERSPMGEGRSIVRSATWRIGTTNDDSLELSGDIEMDLEQDSRRSDLSPTGTIESYRGTIQSNIDTSLMDRVVEETMTMLWRVDSLETRVESTSSQVLRRLVDIPRAPKSDMQQGGRSETLRHENDG